MKRILLLCGLLPAVCFAAAPSGSVLNSANPASLAAAVTPSDTTSFTVQPRALYVGTGGSVSVLLEDGTTVVFSNVPDGSILPVRAMRVNSATTASNILALY